MRKRYNKKIWEQNMSENKVIETLMAMLAQHRREIKRLILSNSQQRRVRQQILLTLAV